MENNKYSIIIPALNEEHFIRKCLESLKQQDYDGEYEIIVVDNGSIDNTPNIAKQYGALVLTEPIKGISNALIKGCANASGDILLFTDADTIIPKDWVTRYNEIFRSDKEIVIAGGLYEFYDKRFLAKILFNKILKPISTFVLEKFIIKKYPVLPCVNMAIRKDAYNKTAGFDANIKWGQEIDIAKKLTRIGKLYFDKNILVYTSFRRYATIDDSSFKAFLKSIKELIISIYRMLTMAKTNKTFPAQEEIRYKED